MNRIYLPSSGPDAWKQFLADPDKQWKTGYSARTLAHAWEAADGKLPAEIAALFDQPTQLLIAIPEHKVALKGGRRESQNDVFALVRSGEETISVTIEGKVREQFGPTLGEWLNEASDGKCGRLEHIADLLGLTPDDILRTIRYQLLHRTASAIIEAEQFKTDWAAMIVHSFAEDRIWFNDFAAFADLFGLKAEVGKMVYAALPSGRQLGLGWACGDTAFLKI